MGKILITRIGGDDYLARPSWAFLDLDKGLVKRLLEKIAIAKKASKKEETSLSFFDYSPSFTGDQALVYTSLSHDQETELEDGGHVVVNVAPGFELPPGKLARIDWCSLHVTKDRAWWEANEKHCSTIFYTYNLWAEDIKKLAAIAPR